MKAKSRLFKSLFLFTAFMLFSCSSEESASTDDDMIGNENPVDPDGDTGGNDGDTTSKTPDTSPPVDLYIVNIGFAEKGASAHVTRNKDATFRGNANYEDIVGDKDILHLFGANYNTDGSVPLTEPEQPEAHSKRSVRNNMTISFVLSSEDDENANAILRVDEAVTFSSGNSENTALNVTRVIESGKVKVLPIPGKEDKFLLGEEYQNGISYTDDELSGKDIGNLNIADNPDVELGITYAELQDIFGTPGDYYIIKIEVSVDDDNMGSSTNERPSLYYLENGEVIIG